MKRAFSLRASFAAPLLLTLLLAAPAGLSAQFLSGLGDANPGEDAVTFGLIYGQMSPTSEFRDGSSFDAGSAMGVSLGFWAARNLGFQVSMTRSNHVASLAADGRSSIISGRDPRIDTYLVDMVGRLPLMEDAPLSLAPYLAIGGGWKSYHFEWDTKGGPDARGLDLTWGPAAGVELRFGAEHRLGVRGEFRQLMTKMERWGDVLTHKDRVLTGALLVNF